MFRLLCFTGGFAATNGYLLVCPDGEAVLIDAPEGVASWRELEKVRLRGLLLTHAHFDHVLGAAAVAERFGCPVHAFAQPEPALTLVALLAFAGMPAHVLPFTADVLLTESSAPAFGSLTFRVLHVPGHSPDSLCFLPSLPDADGRQVLFGGDVLFQGSIGRTDFPHSDHRLLVRGIQEKLYALPGATVVFPGHGPETSIAEERETNPFVRAR